MDINKSITTKGGAAKEREKKRIKLNVAAKSCQNIQHFFMPINKINEHDIDDPASVSNLILKHNSENQINDECDNTSQEKEPNLKVVTSSDTQVIECENTSQEDYMTNLEVITLSVCFDGASTMSGHLNGVQSKCKEKNNSIMYVHCYAHCLNLVLVDSICEKSNSKGKQNRLVFNFLGTVQFIYNFIESSPMRHATLEKVAKETGDKLHTLKSCSNTRWACRAEAVKAIMNNYEVLIIAIENICENCSVPEMRAKGIGLLYQLKTFDFIFGMHMMNPILMLILKVSTLLQEPNLNLVLAMKNVNSLRSTLDSMRNDDSEYKQMFDRSVILCKKHDIVIPDSNSRKVSTRLDSNSSNQAFFNTKFDELKITVFYPLLDKLLSGIDSRFKQDTFDLVDAMAFSEEDLITELKLLKNYENAMQLNGASSKSIYEWIDWLKTTGNSTVYTCVFKTLKMFTIIPVTSCTCERVFSKLTIVKNKLRSTMSQERLESLLLLFTEQEMVSKVDLNAVIDEFNSKGNRRMSL
ncbi:zinc finger MYM-type protein 1-like [Myzus persicae]|uniref:zinc finger MYM-type protein 1-like n=1 Tax=Myzus persicae TaxID=13164 RepID=UPI000B933F2E|nr:zinc finger MYM-type protein 1-like [Myzus persicae]